MASKVVDENLILNFGDLPSEGEVFRQKIVFVDVGSDEHEWREVCKFIASLGATLISRVTDCVDFCVFKDGSKTTWDACSKYSVPRVRVTYVMECKMLNFLVDMDDFLSPSPYQEEEAVQEKLPSPAVRYRFSPTRACSPLKSDEELEELDVVMRRHMERKSLQNVQKSLLNFDVASTPEPIACSSIRRDNPMKSRVDDDLTPRDVKDSMDKSEEDLFKDSENEHDVETTLNTRRNAKKSYKKFFNDSDLRGDKSDDNGVENSDSPSEKKLCSWRNRDREIDYSKKIFPKVEQNKDSSDKEAEDEDDELSSFINPFDGDFEDSLDDDPKRKSFTHRRVVRMQNSQLLTSSPICDEEELRIENLRNLGKLRCDKVNVIIPKQKSQRRKRVVKKSETKKEKASKKKSDDLSSNRTKIRKRKETLSGPPKEYRRILNAKKHDMSIYDFPNTQSSSQQTEQLVFKKSSDNDECQPKNIPKENNTSNPNSPERENSVKESVRDTPALKTTSSEIINEEESDTDFFPSQLAESISIKDHRKSRKNGTLCAPVKTDSTTFLCETSKNIKTEENNDSSSEDFWSSQLCRSLSSNSVKKSRRNGTLCSNNTKTAKKARKSIEQASALEKIAAVIAETDNFLYESSERENKLKSNKPNTRKRASNTLLTSKSPKSTRCETVNSLKESMHNEQILNEAIQPTKAKTSPNNKSKKQTAQQRRRSNRIKSSAEEILSSADNEKNEATLFKVPLAKKSNKAAKSSKLPVPCSHSGNSSNDENYSSENNKISSFKTSKIAVRRSTRSATSNRTLNSGTSTNSTTSASSLTVKKDNVSKNENVNLPRKTNVKSKKDEICSSDEGMDFKKSSKLSQADSLNVKLIKRRKRQTISTPPSHSLKYTKRNVVFSSCNSKQQQLFAKALERLGKFTLKKSLTSKNDILVLGNNKRTLKVIQATISGCMIVSFDWIEKSLLNCSWLDLETFETKELFQTASKVRCGIFKLNLLFQKVGKIFIADDTQPDKVELVKLIKSCGGSVTEIRSNAKVIIGTKNTKGKLNGLSPTWAIDSIMANKLMAVGSEYIL
ncbi:unnamed protein product [Dimorphilus gyrociliatus]|uniref:DgyrCDS706 n=1 Tax=Dimorphilus gyrociliatus TaxID=2664684 RepID=A0A7I8V9Z7_9ANNE|nr:DgyrCDS706 [Dimorphilus gyrociliatus]CAD5111393.1 unnamed protein product [Dimorphilus gyrociliatus]